MILFLCGFASYLAVQFLRYLIPIREAFARLLLNLAGSCGVSAYYFSNQPVHLLIYGFAGGGMAVLIDQLIYVSSVGGDHLMSLNVRNRRR
jgi:hypothetical protein